MDSQSELSQYRSLHESKYQQRIENESLNEAQQADALFAQQLQEAEQKLLDSRVLDDENYSRQLYEQLNQCLPPAIHNSGVAASQSHPIDSHAEVRAPMRTGYNERLIDDSPFFSRSDAIHGLLEGSSRVFGWNPFHCIENCVTDEEDRRAGWHVGPFFCTRRIVSVYMLLLSIGFVATLIVFTCK